MFTITAGTRVNHFLSRTECIDWARENIDPMDTNWSIKEDAKPCRECGELCESQWSSLCRSCQFKLNDAVKAARKIIRSAKRHGDPVISVWDGGDTITGNERELLEAVHSVDFSRLTLQSGAWVSVICGEETEADCIPDYSLSIEKIVDDANLRED